MNRPPSPLTMLLSRHTRRRDFIAGLGAAAWPLAARSQQGDRIRHIGVLIPFEENDPLAEIYVSAFIQALGDLGWTDGRTVRMDLRWAGGDTNRIRAVAQEFVGLQPDIIVTDSTPATIAVQRETRTIPIVPSVPKFHLPTIGVLIFRRLRHGHPAKVAHLSLWADQRHGALQCPKIEICAHDSGDEHDDVEQCDRGHTASTA